MDQHELEDQVPYDLNAEHDHEQKRIPAIVDQYLDLKETDVEKVTIAECGAPKCAHGQVSRHK